MNWYKTAERKSLQELLQSLDSNPGVDRKTIAWLKALESKEKGSAINTLTKNPSASIEEIKSLFPIVVPLTPEQKRLVTIYPLIGEWMRGVMSVLSGQKRDTAFNTLTEKAAGIRDWIDRTGERLQGRTLENAVKETEKWHSESISLEQGEYLPTKPEDIIISYQNKYTWQRISRGTDAKIEGQKMKHCVGNYCDDVEQGKIDLYSLRDENNSPLVTAGFKYNSKVVVQMKGPANADPSEKYKGYISDILKRLGTVYNDGERYLSNYNLKNFRDLNADDIEKSTLLQKIVNNQIAREGDPPYFAYNWAKKILDSGAAPKAWKTAITSYIAKNVEPPDWARDWAKKILDSGTAPKAWEAGITSRIERMGYPPDFAQYWAKKALDSGKAPKALEEAITSIIAREGRPPAWAQTWAKKVLDSGSAPKAWEEGINSRIELYGYPSPWTEDWVKSVLDSGKAPKAWEEGINSHIEREGRPPAWAQTWAKKVLDSGSAPKAWEEGINSHIERWGYPPAWAWNAGLGVATRSSRAPKAWEEAITSIIAREGRPPAWARDLAKKVLDSGKAPKAWEEGITSYITRSGEPPNWAQDWYYKNENYKR